MFIVWMISRERTLNEQKGESGSRSESVTVARAFLAVWQSQFGSRRQTTKSASYRSTSTISPGDVRELKYTYTYSITLKFNLLRTLRHPSPRPPRLPLPSPPPPRHPPRPQPPSPPLRHSPPPPHHPPCFPPHSCPPPAPRWLWRPRPPRWLPWRRQGGEKRRRGRTC